MYTSHTHRRRVVKPQIRRCRCRVRFWHGSVAWISFFFGRGGGILVFSFFFWRHDHPQLSPPPPPTPSSPLSRPGVYSRECMRRCIHLAASVCLVSLSHSKNREEGGRGGAERVGTGCTKKKQVHLLCPPFFWREGEEKRESSRGKRVVEQSCVVMKDAICAHS